MEKPHGISIPLRQRFRNHSLPNQAYIVLAAFLASLLFLRGGAANTVAILCFAAAWLLVAQEPSKRALSFNPILVVFLSAASVRLLLPPYGDTGAVPGAAITRALMLAGLYGLTLYVYARLPFSHILWFVAGSVFASTIIALGLYVSYVPSDSRLALLGRASHPIFGAGAVAAGAIATLTLLAFRPKASRSLLLSIALVTAFCTLLTAIYLTGSRGPMLALIFALCAAPLIMRSGSKVLLFACVFGAWALVTASVLLEAPIKQALCSWIELACRPSLRSEVWSASLALIAEHPAWGSGYGFRFEGIQHAHNAYLGMALHYGIPLLVLFLCLMATALSQAVRIKDKEERFFVVAMLIFANGYMGSDLSDPMRFFNTHYLFLWFPLFLAMVAAKIGSEPVACQNCVLSTAAP